MQKSQTTILKVVFFFLCCSHSLDLTHALYMLSHGAHVYNTGLSLGRPQTNPKNSCCFFFLNGQNDLIITLARVQNGLNIQYLYKQLCVFI